MGFPRQEYWSGLPCPPPGDLPNPGTEPGISCVSCIVGGFFTHWAIREAPNRTGTQWFLVPYSFFVFCCLSKHCSPAAKGPRSQAWLTPIPLPPACWTGHLAADFGSLILSPYCEPWFLILLGTLVQRPLGLFQEISPFCVSGWLAVCDSRGSSYPPKSPQPLYFWMWVTAVFSVLGQVLTHSAFLVLFQPNGCPGALPQKSGAGVITCFWLGPALLHPWSCHSAAALTSLPHTACWGAGLRWSVGPGAPPLWLSLQFKDLRDHLNCPRGALNLFIRILGGEWSVLLDQLDGGGIETWHPSGWPSLNSPQSSFVGTGPGWERTVSNVYFRALSLLGQRNQLTFWPFLQWV